MNSIRQWFISPDEVVSSCCVLHIRRSRAALLKEKETSDILLLSSGNWHLFFFLYNFVWSHCGQIYLHGPSPTSLYRNHQIHVMENKEHLLCQPEVWGHDQESRVALAKLVLNLFLTPLHSVHFKTTPSAFSTHIWVKQHPDMFLWFFFLSHSVPKFGNRNTDNHQVKFRSRRGGGCSASKWAQTTENVLFCISSNTVICIFSKRATKLQVMQSWIQLWPKRTFSKTFYLLYSQQT